MIQLKTEKELYEEIIKSKDAQIELLKQLIAQLKQQQAPIIIKQEDQPYVYPIPINPYMDWREPFKITWTSDNTGVV